MPFWILGGVGVDLLVGRFTRPHGDIDLAIDRRQRARSFADLGRAGFRVTRNLGWHTRWSRSTREIGELDVGFALIEPDGSSTLIVCPEDAIGEPGPYMDPPGSFELSRYGAIEEVRCRVASAAWQLRCRRGYRALFPDVGDAPKVQHDLDLLAILLSPNPPAEVAEWAVRREPLRPGDCEQ
jgi:hypothetical protein